METSKDGFTDHEILLEIRNDLKQHIRDGSQTETDLREQIAKRPTRTEVVLWLSGTGTLVGIVLAVAG